MKRFGALLWVAATLAGCVKAGPPGSPQNPLPATFWPNSMDVATQAAIYAAMIRDVHKGIRYVIDYVCYDRRASRCVQMSDELKARITQELPGMEFSFRSDTLQSDRVVYHIDLGPITLAEETEAYYCPGGRCNPPGTVKLVEVRYVVSCGGLGLCGSGGRAVVKRGSNGTWSVVGGFSWVS